MFDLHAILFGILFGFVLAFSIIMLLLYATIQAPESEHKPYQGNAWRTFTRHESQRSFFHTSGYEPDVFDW